MDVLRLDESNETAAAHAVASLLRRGGVAAIPTDTVYGLAADIRRPIAVRKIFRLKARAHHTALPIFVRDIAMARVYAVVSRSIEPLLGELWPGQTTVVLRKRDTVPDLVTGGSPTVGLRVPDHPFLAALLGVMDRPMTATSANLSGSEPAQSADEVRATFQARYPQPELLVDAGPLPARRPSTVLDLTHPEHPKILRMGAITKKELDRFLAQWKRIP